jgi:hypothetical protein
MLLLLRFRMHTRQHVVHSAVQDEAAPMDRRSLGLPSGTPHFSVGPRPHIP